mmetsp:Transcript_18007/g.30137  ORF Transcript_18007/g.30137 Transcript_18007/m.30137 type:complete len:105 (-) Transcript_18007:886-1200(-)
MEDHEVPLTYKDITKRNKVLKKKRKELENEVLLLEFYRRELQDRLKDESFSSGSKREIVVDAIREKGNEIDSRNKKIADIDTQFEANRIIRNDIQADKHYDCDY